MEPVKLYVAPRHGTRHTIRLIEPSLPEAEKKRKVLFKTLPKDFHLDRVLVERIEDADFVIVPEAVKYADAKTLAYLESVRDLAARHDKQAIVCLTGDLSHRLHIPIEDLIIMNPSQYLHDFAKNEVTWASFVEDLGEQYGVEPRGKPQKPVIGFCGYAAFPSWKTRAKYVMWNAYLDARAIVTGNPYERAYKRGIYFRRRAIKALSSDPRVETSFIIRNTFSANAGTVGMDPAKVREEYVQNLIGSDFVLAPKGDANFSSRFFEALSLGRIPILIDTDMVMPFSKTIDYDRFIIRVPFQDVDHIADYVFRWLAPLSDEEFRAREEEARVAFRDHLRFDSYQNEALPILRDQGVRALQAL